MTPGELPQRHRAARRCTRGTGRNRPIIINLQGDAPLPAAFVIGDFVAALAADRDVGMATPAEEC